MEAYNGSVTDTKAGWDTKSSDLNVFYDVSLVQSEEHRRSLPS